MKKCPAMPGLPYDPGRECVLLRKENFYTKAAPVYNCHYYCTSHKRPAALRTAATGFFHRRKLPRIEMRDSLCASCDNHDRKERGEQITLLVRTCSTSAS